MSILTDAIKKTEVLPHVQVCALAGTGKTTTIVDMALNKLRGNPLPFEPSEEQQAIIDAIAPEGYNPRSILMVAFNKSIQLELDKRTPDDVQCKTMHSLGFGILRQHFNLKKGKYAINKWKVDNLISEVLGEDCKVLRKKHQKDYNAIKKMVSHCKIAMLDPSDIADHELDFLAANYQIKITDYGFVFDTAKKVLKRNLDIAKDREVNFDDMIWLPVALGLEGFKYDLVFYDEAQDASKLHQSILLNAGRRIVIVGDKNQAIYGFAGADSNSMQNFITLLDGETKSLPMNATRRCGWEIIKEAQKIVPQFTGADNVGQGKVSNYGFLDGSYRKIAKGGDMVLSRVNAPLIGQCLKFIKAGIKASIIGREFGEQLSSIVLDNFDENKAEFLQNMEDWKDVKLKQKGLSDQAQIAIIDQFDCLVDAAAEIEAMDQLSGTLLKMFTDTENDKCVRLSTIHKSKGLEADTVFVIDSQEYPVMHPMDMKGEQWQIDSAYCLKYVAITRAINHLVWVK